jgi:hypothetical protein
MAITFVGSSSGTNSLTEPAHQAGDVLIFVALRDGSNSPPSSPGNGYSLWWDNTTNSIGAILGMRVATNSTQLSLTSTNATQCVCLAYRGCSNPNLVTFASSRNTGSGTTCTNVALTLNATTSWVVTFKGTREAGTTASANVPPAGCTQRLTTGTTAELGAADTNGPAGTTNWTPPNQTISSGSTGWVTFAVELREAGSTETITVDPGSVAVTGGTVWLHVVDNPYPDLPVPTGSPPTGYIWPDQMTPGNGEIDPIAFGWKNDSQIPGQYIDFACHNGAQTWSFTSDRKYVKMEVHSGDQYHGDSSTSERSEMGTMRTYWDFGNRYVFEFNSLLSGSAANSAPW